MTKSLARNLNGLEIEGKSSLKTYIKDNDINFYNLRTMDLVIENIKPKDTRFLLLASEKSMFGFLMDIIKKELEKMNSNSDDNGVMKEVVCVGSPFKGD